MAYAHIQWRVEGSVGMLTLNRPDKFNSFNGDMHAELRHALDALYEQPQVRALVLTGAGKAFCAGQDLADPEVSFVPGQTPPDLGAVVARHYQPLITRLTQCRVPTVCALNGVAAGAGASVALACDMVVASESASFMLPFAKLGLIPDTACSWIVTQRLGLARAMGLAMTGQKLTATQAKDWGLIWATAPADQFMADAMALAQQMANLPTDALVRTRELMLASHTRTIGQQMEAEARAMTELGRSADYVEGVAAFLEKRPTRFNPNA